MGKSRFFTRQPSHVAGGPRLIAAAFGAFLLSGATSSAQEPSPTRVQSSQGNPSIPQSIAGPVDAGEPNPLAPGFRIPLPPLEQMDPAQRAKFEQDARPLHTPIGPRTFLTVSPNIEEGWTTYLREVNRTQVPKDLWQLTVLVVAREWDSQFEWWVHVPMAMRVGVSADVIEAIRVVQLPKFPNAGEEATYLYMVELLRDRKVSDATYERLRAIIGTRQMVEITAVAGYYVNNAMSLSAHQLPLRPDLKPPLPELANRFPLKLKSGG